MSVTFLQLRTDRLSFFSTITQQLNCECWLKTCQYSDQSACLQGKHDHPKKMDHTDGAYMDKPYHQPFLSLIHQYLPI